MYVISNTNFNQSYGLHKLAIEYVNLDRFLIFFLYFLIVLF